MCARRWECRSRMKHRRGKMETRMEHRIVASAESLAGSASPARVANQSAHAKPGGKSDSQKPDSQKREESDSPFAVSVTDVYEGPLDLLLDLIRKQHIDIYDIPIARITAQYLAYVEKIRELDVNVAADFIYMAAVLIHIVEDAAAARSVGEG